MTYSCVCRDRQAFGEDCNHISIHGQASRDEWRSRQSSYQETIVERTNCWWRHRTSTTSHSITNQQSYGRQSVSFSSEVTTEFEGGAAVVGLHLCVRETSHTYFFNQTRILVRRRTDNNRSVVLGRRTKHGRTTNINILDTGLKVVTLLHGILESIKVQDNKVNLLNVVVNHVLFVLFISTNSKDTTVNL